jgi:hypothetical protein
MPRGPCDTPPIGTVSCSGWSAIVASTVPSRDITTVRVGKLREVTW